MTSDRGERSALAYEDPRRTQGLPGRGDALVTIGGGPGPSRDGACEYAAAVERRAGVGVHNVAFRADVGPEEITGEVLRDADGPDEVRSDGAEIRRKVAVVPGT